MEPGTFYLIIFQLSYLTLLIGIDCTLSRALLAIDLMLSKPSLLIPTHRWLHRIIKSLRPSRLTWMLLLRFLREKRQIKIFNHFTAGKGRPFRERDEEEELGSTHLEVPVVICLLGSKSQLHGPVPLKHVWYDSHRTISWRTLNFRVPFIIELRWQQCSDGKSVDRRELLEQTEHHLPEMSSRV